MTAGLDQPTFDHPDETARHLSGEVAPAPASSPRVDHPPTHGLLAYQVAESLVLAVMFVAAIVFLILLVGP